MRSPASISLAQAIDRCVGRPLYLRPSSAATLARVLSRREAGRRSRLRASLAESRGRARGDLAPRIAALEPLAGKRADDGAVVVIESEEGEQRGGASYTIVGEGLAVVPVLGAMCKDHPGMWASFGPFTCYRDLTATTAAALDDQRVKAVLLLVDSTGGEAAGCFDAVDDLLALRDGSDKPLGAFADGVAASAGYAVLMCATPGLCFAADGSEVGSIGAVQIVDEWRERPDDRVKRHVIASGVYKAAYYPEHPKDDATLAYLQRGIDDCAAVFIDRVHKARGLDPAAVSGLEAACVMGFRAADLGLIDDRCNLREAARRTLAAAAPAAASPSPAPPPVAVPFERAAPGDREGDETPNAKTRKEHPMGFLDSLRAPAARRAENDPPAKPEDDKPANEGGDTPEDEPMTPEKLRELYPDAVEQIEREAAQGQDPEDEPEDDKPKPEPAASAASPASIADLKAAGITDSDFLLGAVEAGLSLPAAKKSWALAGVYRQERDAARAEARTARESMLSLADGAPPVPTGRRPASAGTGRSGLAVNGRTPEQMLADPACVAAYGSISGDPSFDGKSQAQRRAFLGYVKDEIAADREPFADPDAAHAA